MQHASSQSVRRDRAVESFQTAADCIGKIEKGHALFAVTRGQFSMIDAIMACLAQTGPAHISIWTWTTAEHDVKAVQRLFHESSILGATLMIDAVARNKKSRILEQWIGQFGKESIKYVRNHAKISTIHNDKFQILLRGSMNLNFNPQFEQFDLTEGGEDFKLVKQIESELPVLCKYADGSTIYAASKVDAEFSSEQMSMFKGMRRWRK